MNLPETIKKKKFFILTFLSLILLVLCGFFFFQKGQNQILGVQLVTDKGTYLIGRNKLSGKMNTWFSPLTGYILPNGKQGLFFSIERQKQNAKGKNWQIDWEWDEIKFNKQSLIGFGPTAEEKDASIETLKNFCAENNSEEDCKWSIANYLSFEGMFPNHLCLADSSVEFTGGVHPIELRRFGTFDLKTKKFIRLDDFVKNEELKDKIWERLYQNLKATTKPSEESEEITSIQDTTIEPQPEQPTSTQEKLISLLNSQGYSFNPNVFCLSIQPEGLSIVFGFPHSEQTNRGLNLRVQANLSPSELTSDLQKLLNVYEFNNEESFISSAGKKHWSVKRLPDEIEVFMEEGKSQKIKLKEQNLLGIFWIHQSPNLAVLKKYGFTKVKQG